MRKSFSIPIFGFLFLYESRTTPRCSSNRTSHFFTVATPVRSNKEVQLKTIEWCVMCGNKMSGVDGKVLRTMISMTTSVDLLCSSYRYQVWPKVNTRWSSRRITRHTKKVCTNRYTKAHIERPIQCKGTPVHLRKAHLQITFAMQQWMLVGIAQHGRVSSREICVLRGWLVMARLLSAHSQESIMTSFSHDCGGA